MSIYTQQPSTTKPPTWAVFVGLGIVFFFAFLTSTCVLTKSVKPGPGQVAVLIDQPWFPWFPGNGGGVRPDVVGTGSKWVWRSTDPVIVEMQPFKVDANFDDMNSSDGVPLDFHAQANMKVTDAVRLIRDFGPNWYINNLAKPFESYTRRAVNKWAESAITTSVDLDGNPVYAGTAERKQSVMDVIDDEVTAGIKAEIEKLKLPIVLTDLTLGKANPPKEILDQRTKTAQERQRGQTERQAKLAEDQRKQREIARAEADAAYNLKMNAAGGANLSPELSLRLREIEMKREVCARANCTFWFGEQPLVTAAAK